MSKLSDYLNAHIPEGWSKMRVVEALDGRVDRATVYRYFAGQHPQRPAESILEAFAELPGVSLTELRMAVGAPAGEDQPWIPTKEANRLNHGQRLALDAFIRATVNAQDEARLGEVVAELLEERQGADQQLEPGIKSELEQYVEVLYSSGRNGLAERLAASLATSSASQRAKRSSTE